MKAFHYKRGKSYLTCTKTSFHLYNNYQSLNYLAKSVSQLPIFSFLHYYPFSAKEIKALVANLTIYKYWQAERVRSGQGGHYTANSDKQFGKTTTAWPPQYDISPGEGNFTWNVRANIDRDRLTIEVIHYWALIMAPLLEPPESLCESPSTPLGFWGWWDDCEWCEWWLWRWMTVSGAKPEPRGAHWDLIQHLQICLPSPRANIKPSAPVIEPPGTALLERMRQRDAQTGCNFILLIPS